MAGLRITGNSVIRLAVAILLASDATRMSLVTLARSGLGDGGTRGSLAVQALALPATGAVTYIRSIRGHENEKALAARTIALSRSTSGKKAGVLSVAAVLGLGAASVAIRAAGQDVQTLPLPAPVTVLDIYVPFFASSFVEALGAYGNRFNELDIFSLDADRLGRLKLASPLVEEAIASASLLGRDVVLTVTNDRPGLAKDRRLAHRWIAEPSARKRFIEDALNYAADPRVRGLDLDIENIFLGQRIAVTRSGRRGRARRIAVLDDGPAYVRLISDLAQALNARGKYLEVTLEVATHRGDHPLNWAAIAAVPNVKKVRIMAYAWHWEKTSAGSIAPPEEVLAVGRDALDSIGPEKAELVLGMFGYDWGPRKGRAELVGTYDAFLALAAKGKVKEIGSDPLTHSAVFSYEAPRYERSKRNRRLRIVVHSQRHSVWFDDAESVRDKIKRLKAMGFRSVALWHIGSGVLGLFNGEPPTIAVPPAAPPPLVDGSLPALPQAPPMPAPADTGANTIPTAALLLRHAA